MLSGSEASDLAILTMGYLRCFAAAQHDMDKGPPMLRCRSA